MVKDIIFPDSSSWLLRFWYWLRFLYFFYLIGKPYFETTEVQEFTRGSLYFN